MATKRSPNSHKGSRRWARLGLKGRVRRLRMADTGHKYRPARRIKRWAKGLPPEHPQP